MCKICKCHTSSWILLFLAAEGSFCFIWPFALLPSLYQSPPPLFTLVLLSPSVSFPPTTAPPALCCDRTVRLSFGWAACSAGRQPVQCVEPKGCTQCLREPLCVCLVSVYQGHDHQRVTQHLLLLTSLQPGGGGASPHTNCPSAHCSQLQLLSDQQSKCATVDP